MTRWGFHHTVVRRFQSEHLASDKDAVVGCHAVWKPSRLKVIRVPPPIPDVWVLTGCRYFLALRRTTAVIRGYKSGTPDQCLVDCARKLFLVIRTFRFELAEVRGG